MGLVKETLLEYLFYGQSQRYRIAIEIAAYECYDGNHGRALERLKSYRPLIPVLWFRDRGTLYQLAHAYLLRANGDAGAARELLKKLPATSSLSPGVAGLVALHPAQDGDEGLGEELWQRQLADPAGHFPWDLAGFVLLIAKDYARAKAAFDLGLNQGDVSLLFPRFLCYKHSSKRRADDSVIDAGRAALMKEREPNRRLLIHLELLTQHYILAEYGEMEALVADLRHHHPQRLLPHLVCHGALINLRRGGHIDLAVERLEKDLDQLLAGGEWFQAWGLMYLEGDYRRCMEILSTRNATDELTQICRGITLLGLGRPSDALSTLENFRNREPLSIGEPFTLSSKTLLLKCYEDLLMKREASELLQDPHFSDSARSGFALLWEGRVLPAAEDDWNLKLYRGEFDKNLLTATAVPEVTGWPLQNAETLYRTATALHWAEDFEAASQLYDRAVSLWGPDLHRADHCRLQSLECKALAGRKVRVEWDQLRPRLQSAYPQDKLFQAEIVQTDFVVLFQEGRYEEGVQRVEEFLQLEPRNFFKALALHERVKVHKKIGNLDACRADLAQIKVLAPGSLFDKPLE